MELFNFSFFNSTGWGIDLDYCDIEWFALETNRDHSVVFEISSKKSAFQTSLLTTMATPFLLRDSCPQCSSSYTSKAAETARSFKIALAVQYQPKESS